MAKQIFISTLMNATKYLLLLAPIFSSAIELEIDANIRIRFIKGKEARDYDSFGKVYLLKKGAIIEVPDSMVSKDPNTGKLMLNESQSYRIRNKNNDAKGRDLFTSIKVKSNPGGLIPPNSSGSIALDYLVRNKKAKAASESNSATKGPVETPPSAIPPPTASAPLAPPVPTAFIASAASPTSSTIPDRGPDKKSKVPGNPSSPAERNVYGELNVKEERAKFDALTGQLPDPLKSKTVSLPSSAGPELQKTLAAPINMISAEESQGPKPAEIIDETNTKPPTQKLLNLIVKSNHRAKDAGQTNKLCPSEQCDVAQEGWEENSTIACQQALKGDFPGNLEETNERTLYAGLRWWENMMFNPIKCDQACKFSENFLEKLFSTEKNNLNHVCETAVWCHNYCRTSTMVALECVRKDQRKEQECEHKCSAFGSITDSKRKALVYQMYLRAHQEIKKLNPSLAAKVERTGDAATQARTMTCVNLKRENAHVEPMASNCASTAIGLGQVLDLTFFETLGIQSLAGIKNCKNVLVKDLGNCRGYVASGARMDIYGSQYDHLTLNQIYERRSFDVELQARSSYAVYVNKLIYHDFNTNNALQEFFGFRDKRATSRINRCKHGNI
jgi:hypothetical protein